MTLRLKILLILASACLVGDAFLVLLWHPWQVRTLIERERVALQEHLVTLGDAITPFLLQNQIGAIHEVLDATLERQPDWKSLVLSESSGLTLYPLDPQSVASAEYQEHFKHEVVLRNTSLGMIELVADFSPVMTAQMRSTRIFVALITAGFLLTALMIASLLEVLLGRRARQLVTAAQRMSEDDFNADLPTASSDEIGRLARAFADMRTAIHIKEDSLRESRQAAEASNQAKSTFLATMSHEIRTPMNGILGMAQLLLSPNLTEDERREFSRTILNSGQSLLTLLNDILDLSKVEAGRIELTQDVFRPAQLLDEVAALFREMASRQGLNIETCWQGDPGMRFRGDAGRLRQMLSNLVSNAIKFSESGTIKLSATEVQRVGGQSLLEISVTDNGIGIPEDKLPQLFQPFTQLDGSHTRKYAGTGLGLSIVRSLAMLMGGDVGVDSKEGQGSTFWFRIRVTLVEPQEESRQTLRVSINPAMTGLLHGRRILVVEDNLTNQVVVKALLERQGVSVVCVGDGQAALHALEAGHGFDAVLMDCQMPVMDGFTATAKLREREAAAAHPRLPIIALTAGAFEDDRKACLAAGMDDYLAKPIKLDDLITTLGRWLHA